MASGLIYGAVVRGSNVLAQYYRRRDARDLEALAKELGTELFLIDPHTAYAEKPRIKELMEVSVLVLGRKIKADSFCFVCVCDIGSEDEGEKYLEDVSAQCKKDMLSEKPPTNLSSHFAKKIKALMSGHPAKAGAKNIELGRVQRLEAEVSIMTEDAMRNIGSPC